MTGLVTVADLVIRKVEFETNDQAEAAIADASALARLIADGALDLVSAPDTPAGVVGVLCAMIRRGLDNPRGLAQETLGDYSYATGGQGVATIYATARERKIIRRAVGALGVGSFNLEVDLPVQPSEPSLEQDPLA